MKMVGNAFLTDQCTKFIFALLLCWFYLIRTQAFSVFSEASSRVAAPQRDRTIHKCQRVWNSNCTNKGDCGWPCVRSTLWLVFFYFFYFYCVFNSPQPTQLAEFTSSVSQLLFLISCSLPRSHGQGFGLKRRSDVSVSSFQRNHFLCRPTLQRSRHRCTAAASCLHKVSVWPKLDFHPLSLQGFHRMGMTRGGIHFLAATWAW